MKKIFGASVLPSALLFAGALFHGIAAELTCTQLDSCTCEMTDGTGTINLHSVAKQKTGVIPLHDSAFTEEGYDGWYYKYNPCEGFSLAGYSDLAILQTDVYEYSGYDLGVQSSAFFNISENNALTIHHTAADNLRCSLPAVIENPHGLYDFAADFVNQTHTPRWSSRVLLICEPVDQHKFEFLGEAVITEYDFAFQTPCACPGYCDDNGVIKPVATAPPIVTPSIGCTFVDSCTCDMDDGSGQVNLHSLALSGISLYDAAFMVTGYDGWLYSYNPCNGFSMYNYMDLALVQGGTTGYYGYDIGVQSSAYFNNTVGNGLSIHYTADDGNRTSRVLLTCDPVDQHIFEFVGETVITEYDFILTTPCACPGYCDENGAIKPLATVPPTQDTSGGQSCTLIDSCTCEMSDGTGKVNLHSLAEYGYYPYDAAFTIQGSDGWSYKYNPCNGFNDYYYYYWDLAVYQGDYYGYYGYDLGVQTSAAFKITTSSGLAVHYAANDGIRSSRIRLICEPTYVNQHRFEYIGELGILEYDFILTSPCACPGKCDNNGVITDTGPINPTDGGGNTGGSGNVPDNIGVNVNHASDDSSLFWTTVGGTMVALLFHDIILVIVIASVVMIGRNSTFFSSQAPGGSQNPPTNNSQHVRTIHLNGGDGLSFGHNA